MTAPALDPRVHDLAARLFWWKTPDEALVDHGRFLAQAMTLGDWEDVQLVLGVYGLESIRAVLADAPPGVFDRRSWDYWHGRCGIAPTPPLPRRRL